jgi:hypothetical protein
LESLLELAIDVNERESSGIKRPTPAEPVFVLLVLRIGQRVQVILEACRSADIFRRATTLTGDAARILLGRIRQQDGFPKYVVVPAIAEVVQILEDGADSG